jgi:hypothetical protein
MEFVPRVLLALILVISGVMLCTTIFTFFGVAPHLYTPYMLYTVALVVLWLFLSPQPVSLIRSAKE